LKEVEVSAKRVKKTLEGRSVLLVVDMLKGFLPPGASLYCGRNSRKLIPFVREKIEEYIRQGDPVIFLKDSHTPHDREFEMFPPHCVRGTWESEIIPELPVPENAFIVPKRRFSGFYRRALARILREIKPSLVEVVGVCTNICVLFTVSDLRNRDYKVRVYRKGVASFDRGAHQFALQQMKTVLGAQVV